ncbi:MFS transporter [Kitasatospora sp. NPDC059160]|uniref:MFS transporter n=1 Tax=Kitasatospora sp. NPDC059160 TaxID=3346748 RepID=UPI0036757506
MPEPAPAPRARTTPPADSTPGTTPDITPDGSTDGTSAPDRRSSTVLWIACAAQFMVVLDVSIVNVALPQVRDSLGLSPAGLQWIVNAYTLGFAGLLLLGGRLADLIGAKRAFTTGLAAFTTASLVCGLAGNGPLLIAARATQGVGGAMLAPATLTLIMTTFTEPRARTRAMGAWSAVMAAGGAAGAVLGGVLTQYAGWRWVFFVNVPIGMVLVVAAVRSVPVGQRPRAGRRLDLPGALTVTLGLTLLTYGIVATETHPWGAPQVWAPVAAALALLTAFAVIEARTAQPLVPLTILRRPVLVLANATVFALGAAMFAMWFLLSLYFQQVLLWDPLRAGLAFVPGALAIIAGARIATRLIGRTGARPLMLLGTAVSTAGFGWLSQITVDGSYATDVLPPFVLCTLGLGLATMPLTVAATAGSRPEEAGLASGLVNTSRQVGGALGLAALASVASHTAASHGGTAAQAATAGYGRALLAAAAFTTVAALLALALPGPRAARG